ncbi:glucuronyl esterase domain-containing protein [Sorangium sp. So ce363]|uniref:glucuronyl esterase domain-containing protein n=1 Tax=Sorangium sp. So ce363 TaxID=3133304 RepID=UPI003F60B29D
MIERRTIRFTTLCVGALCGALMGCSERGPAAEADAPRLTGGAGGGGAGGSSPSSSSGGTTSAGEGGSGGGGPATTPCTFTCHDDCPALGALEVEGSCAVPSERCCWLGAPSDPYPSGGSSSVDDSAPIPVDELPVISEMPDPLTMVDGTKVTTAAQWRARRKEMMRILEDYTYGHMPPPPGNVTAVPVSEPSEITTASGVDATYRKLHLSFGPGGELGFDLGLFFPKAEATPEGEAEARPILISLSFSSGESSLGGAAGALARGYAVATIGYQELGADSRDYASSAFFPAYPDHDWRDISAWAWGISRAVDYLMTDPAVDRDKIMITGTSRLGQAVLLAGAFDERIALTAPVAGGMAFRFSGAEMGGGLGQGITEIVDQNTYWFGPLLPEFRNRTERLPSDQHWLPALTAPRLFILCNSLKDQYGRAYAAVQSYLGAEPVYDFLGVPEHVGLNFRPGGHGATEEDWNAIFDFADQVLLGKPGTRRFDVVPPRKDTP